MESSECQDWGLSLQQEYDTAMMTNNKPFTYDSSDFSSRKVFGGDLEAFLFTNDGKTFVVSSELGGNLWQGFVGVYENWSAAESNLQNPVAYFADSSTTFSCAARLNDSAIVCGADKGTVELLRFTSADNFPDIRIYQTLIGHDDCVTSVSVSMDSTHVISGSMDCTSKSWDLDTGTCVSTSTASSDKILAVIASPENKHLYCTASRDGNLHILDSRLCSGVAPSVLTSVGFQKLSPGAYPTALAWPESSPEIIYAGYSDGTLIRFDLKRPHLQNGGASVQENVSCRPHLGLISSLDVHPDNSLVVVSGSEDGNVCIEDFSLKCEKPYSVFGKHTGFVRCVKWSREVKGGRSSLICSAGWDGKLRSFSTSGLATGH